MFKRIVLLAIVLSFVVACTGNKAQKNATLAAIHYDAGRVYIQDRNFYGALEELVKAVEMVPDNPDYRQVLALTYYARKMYREAISEFTKTLQIKPEHVEANMNLASLYIELKNWDLAIPHLEAAQTGRLLKKREHEMLYNNMGLAYYGIKDYKKSVIYSKKAIELGPNFVFPYYNLGMALDKLGKYDEAMDAYKRAISLMPGYVDAHYNLGVTAVKNKDRVTAKEAFIKVLELDPLGEKTKSARDHLQRLR